MSIEAIKPGFAPIEGIKTLSEKNGVAGAETGGKSDFAGMFSKAIKEVDRMQLDADKQIEGMVLGGQGVTPHEAMIALEKADIAFQLMTQVRAKIIKAYEEVLRTQV